MSYYRIWAFFGLNMCLRVCVERVFQCKWCRGQIIGEQILQWAGLEPGLPALRVEMLCSRTTWSPCMPIKKKKYSIRKFDKNLITIIFWIFEIGLLIFSRKFGSPLKNRLGPVYGKIVKIWKYILLLMLLCVLNKINQIFLNSKKKIIIKSLKCFIFYLFSLRSHRLLWPLTPEYS